MLNHGDHWRDPPIWLVNFTLTEDDIRHNCAITPNLDELGNPR